MSRFRLTAIAAVAWLPACTVPMSTEPHLLHGAWRSVEELLPQGTMHRTFRFRSDGRVIFRVDSYGVYAAGTALSAYTEIVGRYVVEESRLIMTMETMESWDSFYADPRPRTAPFQGSLLDDCTFEIQGNRLTLHYTTYPADAPVPTTMHLTRID